MNRWRSWVFAKRSVGQWAGAAVAAGLFAYGMASHQQVLVGVGAVSLCIVLGRFGNDAAHEAEVQSARRRRMANRGAYDKPESSSGVESMSEAGAETRSHRREEGPRFPASWSSTDEFVEDLLDNDRYALLLRVETKQHLSRSQLMQAVRLLDEAMALVPAGRVLLGQLAEQSHAVGGNGDTDPKLIARNLVKVEPAYLDRFCVSNEQYQKFLDSGGYEQLEYWHEESLPALLDFVDQTGCPGPRYWSDGQFPIGDGQLPVVGVSWFEAWAYARWVGKKLPTDAEWTKAGAWPVESTPGRIAQRRYPWGESFDVRRASLFGSGHHGPVAVNEYPGGVSVGGIHQLIGNVWEWTSTPLSELGDPTLHVSESVISIRGGAFDTYFENHATCHYQSGEQALARRPNIGFRLSLPMRDLEAAPIRESEEPSSETEGDEAEVGLAAIC